MNQLLEVAVELIDRDPDQPRQHFDEVELAELADSIRAHGVIQPIEVERTPDGEGLTPRLVREEAPDDLLGSFRRSWADAMAGRVKPVETLWDELDDKDGMLNE